MKSRKSCKRSNKRKTCRHLKNSIRPADEFSSKLPGTDLYGAPRRGADSNLHWYKMYFIPF